MGEPPLVSAVIATYNRGYVVCEALDSILQQTYKNIEVIVVDDGSTDNTLEKLSGYGSRIRVHRQQNAGPASARNAGIGIAQGSILTFLDSDDTWLPTFVERQVSVLERAGPAVCCSLSNAHARFANGLSTSSFELATLRPSQSEGLWSNVSDVLSTRFVMCGQMLAIRANALKKIGVFNPDLRYLEDYDLALRLSLEGPWAFISEPLVSYHQSDAGDSVSLNISADEARLQESILAIRENARRVLGSRNPPVQSAVLDAAIRTARRDRWFGQLGENKSILGRRVTGLYRVLEHYRLAVYRRSPWFPKMRTAPLSQNA